MVGHAEAPPWFRGGDHTGDHTGDHSGEHAGDHTGDHSGEHEHGFHGPEQDLESLALGEEWEPLTVEVRERAATGPDGEPAVLRDSVVLVRRR